MAVDREMLEAIGQLMDTKLEPVYQRMDAMQGEIKTMQGGMKTMQGDVKEIQERVDTLEGRVAIVQDNSAMQSLEIGLIHSHMEILQQRQSEQIKFDRETRVLIEETNQKQEEQIQYARETRILLEDTNQKIKLLAEGHGETVSKLRKLERMERTLDNVKSDVEVIRTVVFWHSEDIQQLKKA